MVVEVEKVKSELFEAEKSLLQDRELASKLSGSCATQAPDWEKSTETAVARRGTERTSATMATMATQEQVQETLQQPQARGEGGKAAAVPSSFATAETIEQLKDEKKSKQPGNGTQELMDKTDRDRDPRTRGDTVSDRTVQSCNGRARTRECVDSDSGDEKRSETGAGRHDTFHAQFGEVLRRRDRGVKRRFVNKSDGEQTMEALKDAEAEAPEGVTQSLTARHHFLFFFVPFFPTCFFFIFFLSSIVFFHLFLFLRRFHVGHDISC